MKVITYKCDLCAQSKNDGEIKGLGWTATLGEFVFSSAPSGCEMHLCQKCINIIVLEANKCMPSS